MENLKEGRWMAEEMLEERIECLLGRIAESKRELDEHEEQVLGDVKKAVSIDAVKGLLKSSSLLSDSIKADINRLRNKRYECEALLEQFEKMRQIEVVRNMEDI